MENRQNATSLSTNLIIAMLGVIVLIAVGYVLAIAKDILFPFAMAIFVSFILYPVIEFFEKKKIPSSLATLLSIILFAAIIYLLVFLVSDSINQFSSGIEKYQERFDEISKQVESLLSVNMNFMPGSENGDSTILKEITDNLSITGFATSVIGSISSLLSKTFMIILILIFMLLSRNQLRQKIKAAFKGETADRLENIFDNVNIQIRKYIILKTLISITTAVLFMITLAVFGVEFVVVWGILAFVLNFIPNIGSLIATILPIGIAFIQFENPMIALWLTIILIAIQQIMGNLVEPKLLGDRVNLSPIVILFSLVFWGWLWGIWGMFLSVPITVMIKIILENIDATKPISIMMGSK
ncbi:MAG: AI-2E family transporter [Chlorobi bacterium]|nr:AI-2E family transporter [Chlorobiota bacterium]